MKSLCFGAVLWDLIEGQEHLGGAPFNLAVHLRRLGFDSLMASAIGADDRGDRIRDEIAHHRIDGTWVKQDQDHPTACVTVTTDAQGHSTYEIHEDVASDHINLTEDDIACISEIDLDVVCYGTLESRGTTTRRSLFRLLDVLEKKERTRAFCDLNLRQTYYSPSLIRDALVYCDILKLNDGEATVVADLLFPKESFTNDRDFGTAVCHAFDLELVVITRGEQGCLVTTREEAIEEQGISVDVVDTVGPGDAFSAAFLREPLSGGDIATAAIRANRLGAYVASKRGALPGYNEDIERALGL